MFHSTFYNKIAFINCAPTLSPVGTHLFSSILLLTLHAILLHIPIRTVNAWVLLYTFVYFILHYLFFDFFPETVQYSLKTYFYYWKLYKRRMKWVCVLDPRLSLPAYYKSYVSCWFLSSCFDLIEYRMTSIFDYQLTYNDDIDQKNYVVTSIFCQIDIILNNIDAL